MIRSVMAVVLVVLTLPGAVGGVAAPGQPTWYPWVLLVFGPGCVLLGGRMALSRPGGG